MKDKNNDSTENYKKKKKNNRELKEKKIKDSYDDTLDEMLEDETTIYNILKHLRD